MFAEAIVFFKRQNERCVEVREKGMIVDRPESESKAPWSFIIFDSLPNGQLALFVVASPKTFILGFASIWTLVVFLVLRNWFQTRPAFL